MAQPTAVTPRSRPQIAAYLARCRELAGYCSQNGWIDNESIDFDIQESAARRVVVAVKFTEVIMKGAGCEARRMPCFARLVLHFDARGEVVSTTPA